MEVSKAEGEQWSVAGIKGALNKMLIKLCFENRWNKIQM